MFSGFLRKGAHEPLVIPEAAGIEGYLEVERRLVRGQERPLQQDREVTEAGGRFCRHALRRGPGRAGPSEVNLSVAPFGIGWFPQ